MRDAAVGEVDGRRAGAAYPQLVLGLADRKSGRVFLDDERAHPARPPLRIGLGEDDVHIGERGVGDEHLRSVEGVPVGVRRGRGGARAGIGARAGFGQGESAQAAPGRHVMQVLVLLSLGSELEDRPGGERGVRRHYDSGARARPRYLLDRDYVAHVIRSGATLLLRVGHAHEVHLGQLRQELVRETVVAVEFGRDRRHLGLGELPDRVPDQLLLIGQLEVHVGYLPKYWPSRGNVFENYILAAFAADDRSRDRGSRNCQPAGNNVANAKLITVNLG